jgi:GntR family transcriptional regulator / MocR family aminotransferase
VRRLPSDLAITLRPRAAASPTYRQLYAALLCDFIVEGHFSRHLRRMREVYAERLATLVRASARHLDAFVAISPVEAGLQTAVTFHEPMDGSLIAERGEARGVEVVPLSRYSKRRLRRDGLILGFAAVEPAEIVRGVRELTTVLHQARRALRS